LRHHQQENSASCLAACVVMAFSRWGKEISEAEVRRVLKTKPYSGTHAVNLLRLAELGMEAWPQEGTMAGLIESVASGIPVIVFLWTGVLRQWQERGGVDYLHTIVVVGLADDSFWVHDPVLPDGPTRLGWDEFIQAWGYARYLMAVVQPVEGNPTG